jgi:hypothetical protein
MSPFALNLNVGRPAPLPPHAAPPQRFPGDDSSAASAASGYGVWGAEAAAVALQPSLYGYEGGGGGMQYGVGHGSGYNDDEVLASIGYAVPRRLLPR